MYDYQILCFVFLIIDGICGIIFNGVFIVINVRRFEFRKVYALFLTCVSVMNLIYSVANGLLQPFVLVFNLQPKTITCSIIGIITSASGLGCIFNQPFVALNRFIALYHSRKYSKIFSIKNRTLMITFTSTLSILIAMVLFFFDDIGLLGNTVCGPDIESMPFAHIFLFMCPIFVSNVICLFCAFKIWCLIKRHQRGTSNILQSRLQHAKDIFYLIIIELTVPMVLQIPLLILCFLSSNIYVPKLLISAAVCLFITHPVLYPIIIAAVMKPYRSTCINIWQAFRSPTFVESVPMTNVLGKGEGERMAQEE